MTEIYELERLRQLIKDTHNKGVMWKEMGRICGVSECTIGSFARGKVKHILPATEERIRAGLVLIWEAIHAKKSISSVPTHISVKSQVKKDLNGAPIVSKESPDTRWLKAFNKAGIRMSGAFA